MARALYISFSVPHPLAVGSVEVVHINRSITISIVVSEQRPSPISTLWVFVIHVPILIPQICLLRKIRPQHHDSNENSKATIPVEQVGADNRPSVTRPGQRLEALRRSRAPGIRTIWRTCADSGTLRSAKSLSFGKVVCWSRRRHGVLRSLPDNKAAGTPPA